MTRTTQTCRDAGAFQGLGRADAPRRPACPLPGSKGRRQASKEAAVLTQGETGDGPDLDGGAKGQPVQHLFTPCAAKNTELRKDRVMHIEQ